jgi:hypothetical protein
MEDRMARQVGMFDVEDRLAGLSKKGDDLERLTAVVDFGPSSSAPCREPTGRTAAGRRSITS